MDNENYFQNFEELKEANKQKFQELKKKKLTELVQLCNANSLGHEPYQRIASLMQIGTKVQWWKPENQEEKKNIIKGFTELYKAKSASPVTSDEIINIMHQTISKLINEIATQFNPPEIPKSQAKDTNGFSQRELMKIIRKENLAETAKAFDKLLLGIQKTPQANLLIHRTSKILLKKEN